MIDRREYAEREHGNTEHHQVRRKPDGGQRNAAAKEKRRHHIAAAPAVGEPAGRQRENAEGQERRARERDQFAVRQVIDDLEPDHDRRIDQQHEMIEGVGDVDEHDRPIGERNGGHGGTPEAPRA